MDDTRLYDDDARIAALHRLNVLDTAAEKPFEKIVTLVRTVLAVPIATVTLVDRDRQCSRHNVASTTRKRRGRSRSARTPFSSASR